MSKDGAKAYFYEISDDGRQELSETVRRADVLKILEEM
jgi:hypothetical protein